VLRPWIFAKHLTDTSAKFRSSGSLLFKFSFPWRTLEGLRAPSVSLPCSDQVFRYFYLFQAYSAADFTGYFQSEFWNRLLLQESHFNDAIRHAIVAIGTLYKMVETSQAERLSPFPKREGLRHFESALKHYQRAVRSQRKAMEKEDPQLKVSSISCLLFICFEIFQGDWRATEKQVITGVRLLQHYKASLNSGQANSGGSCYAKGHGIQSRKSCLKSSPAWKSS
jgi:hypothetical protein